jgi:thioredoxin-related protein
MGVNRRSIYLPKHCVMRRFILMVFMTGIGAGVYPQAKPVSAEEIMKDALREAGFGRKKVFVFFSASWCGWCHAMDSAIHDPRCQELFESHYVIRKLDVKEEAGKKYLENPGAAETSHYHGK